MARPSSYLKKTLRGLLAGALFCAIPLPAQAQDITSGLIGHWKMEETGGTTITDSTGTQNATFSGDTNVTSGTGRVGKAIYFDGTDDYVTIPSNSEYSIQTVSFAFWIKAEIDHTGWIGLFEHDRFGDNNYNVFIGGSGNDFRMFWNDPDGAEHNVNSSTADIPDTWQHIAGTIDCENAIGTIYIDGVQEDQLTGPFNCGTPTDDIITIGANNTGAENFQGYIDDVRIYNRALSAEDVAVLASGNIPASIRYNEKSEAIEYNNGTNWVHTGLGSYSPNATAFDGSTYLLSGTTLDIPDSKKVTGSVWYKPEADGVYEHIIFGRSPTCSGNCFRILKNNNDSFRINGDGLNMRSAISSVTAGGWYHLLFSFDKSDPTKRHLYVNGVSDLDSVSSYVDAEIPFSGLYHGISAVIDTAGASTGVNDIGEIADFWLDFGTYIDLSDADNRAKFISANGMPMYLGTDGSLPFGFAPDIFLTGATDDWHTNKGTGGGFTENGALTDATTPIIDPATLSETNMGATLTGSSKFGDAVRAGNGKIYGIPRDSTDILIIDPDAGTATRDDMGATLTGSNKWMDGVLGKDGKIYGIPRDATDILIIDPEAGTATRSNMGATLTGTSKWEGGILGADGKIYGIPRDATDILIIDTDTGTATRDDMGATLTGSLKWLDAVLGADDKIYGIPFFASDILIIDTDAGTASRSNMGATLPGGGAWQDGFLGDDGKIYALPFVEQDILIIDTDAGTASRSTMGAAAFTGTEKWIKGGIGGDGKIYGFPYDANDLLIIDPIAGTASRESYGGTFSGDAVYEGAALGYDQKLYGVPRDGSNILVFDARGSCATPAEVAGSIIYNSDDKVMQYCNGVDWVAMGPIGGTGGGGCADPAGSAGDLIYNTDYSIMQYCNSEDWVGLGSFNANGLPTDGDLLHHWKLDETTGATIVDSVGGLNGTWNDSGNNDVGEETVAGVDGTALTFDGSTEILTGGSFNVPQKATITMWAKFDDLGSDLRFFGSDNDFEIVKNGSDVIDADILEGVNNAVSTTVVTTGTWYHIAVAYDGTADTSKLYINGVLEDTGEATGTPPTPDALAIGARDGTGSEHEGALDDVRIYGRVLSDAEIAAIYGLSISADCSGLGDAYVNDPLSGNCYYREDTGTAWATAQTACQANGGYLAVITSSSENELIYSNLRTGRHWIGGTDATSEDAWLWDGGEQDGVQFFDGTTGLATNSLFEDFHANEAGKGGVGAGGPDCLQFGYFTSSGYWDDHSCGDSSGDGYICEVEP